MTGKKINFKNSSIAASYFFKMFTIYSSFTILVISISSFIILNYQNKNLEKEIYKQNKALLTQVKLFSDTYLIEKVKSQVTEKFFNINQDTNVAAFLSSTTQNDDFSIFPRISSELSNIIANSKFITSIYLYRSKDDILVSSKSGIFMNATNSDNPYKNYCNIDLIKYAMSNTNSQNWISPTENIGPNKNGVSPDNLSISFTQTIPMFSGSSGRTGCVVVNIDEEYFSKSINSIFHSTQGYLMILNSKGTLLAPNSNSELFERIKNIKQMNSILAEDEGSTTLKLDKEFYALTWMKSYDDNWKYISLVSVNTLNRQLVVTKQFVFAITVLIILVSLMCLRFITSLIYKPVKNLTNSIKDKLGINLKDINEIDFISNVISNLSSRVQEMDETLDKNKVLIENKIANDILHGNYSNEEEILDRLKLVNKDFTHSSYCVMLCQTNTSILSKLSYEQREFISYKMIDLINSSMYKTFGYINIRNSDNCIVTILNYEGDFSDYMDLSHLLSLFTKELGIPCNIAVSKTSELLSEVSALYAHTKEYLKYRYIYGYNNIFTFSLISGLEEKDESLDSATLNKLEALLKASKIKELEEELEAIVNNIRSSRYSYTNARNILLHITALTAAAIQEQNIDSGKLSTNKLLESFDSINSIDDYINWYHKLLHRYNYEIEMRNLSIDKEFINKINQYIENNIDNQLSLNSVADAFYISPSHLSKIFKKGMGVNFSDFIINKKFQRAAELLIKNKDMEINILSETIGYQNPSYFNKLFKERYGMTPLQYRKKYS